MAALTLRARDGAAIAALALVIQRLARKEAPQMPVAPAKKTKSELIAERAKVLANREDYDVDKIEMVFRPEHGSDLWEVLFLGRYRGSKKAGIKGDEKGARLTYRVWVREDGTGYCTSGW